MQAGGNPVDVSGYQQHMSECMQSQMVRQGDPSEEELASAIAQCRGRALHAFVGAATGRQSRLAVAVRIDGPVTSVVGAGANATGLASGPPPLDNFDPSPQQQFVTNVESCVGREVDKLLDPQDEDYSRVERQCEQEAAALYAQQGGRTADVQGYQKLIAECMERAGDSPSPAGLTHGAVHASCMQDIVRQFERRAGEQGAAGANLGWMLEDPDFTRFPLNPSAVAARHGANQPGSASGASEREKMALFSSTLRLVAPVLEAELGQDAVMVELAGIVLFPGSNTQVGFSESLVEHVLHHPEAAANITARTISVFVFPTDISYVGGALDVWPGTQKTNSVGRAAEDGSTTFWWLAMANMVDTGIKHGWCMPRHATPSPPTHLHSSIRCGAWSRGSCSICPPGGASGHRCDDGWPPPPTLLGERWESTIASALHDLDERNRHATHRKSSARDPFRT